MAIYNPGYCGSGGTFTLSGQFRRGQFLTIPHENCPLTLFVKRCTPPHKAPCAHLSGTGGGQYCSDGTIETVALTTDCTGAYTVTVTGCVLAVGLAIGPWVPNPDFSCSAPPPWIDPFSTGWLAYIRDPATADQYDCARDIGGSGTALSSSIGDLYPDESGGVTDGSSVNGGCGYVSPAPGCLPCIYTTGAVFVTRPTPVTVTYPGDGTVQLQPESLNGSYTLELWDNRYSAGLVAYYTLDGRNYQVGGAQIHLTDSCGRTEVVGSASYPGIAQIGYVDWPNLTSVTVSNWTPDCSPPLYTEFSGPDGPLFVSGPLTGPPGPALPAQTAQLYPVMDDLTRLCIDSFPVFGIKLQTCTGSVPERLQADARGDLLAVAWVSGGALKTACHRSPTRTIGRSTSGWEPTQTVEASGADDIGMVFLPNEGLYLCYALSGSAAYRLNRSFGANGAWSTVQVPSPAVPRHSASGRGEAQAFRMRALGTQTANGPLEFSQCRDNRGSSWTAPVTVTANAQGPYCGGAFIDNRIVCLFSLAQNVSGVGAAGEIYSTFSTDGGATWSAPFFTGFGGQCSGIARTAQGVLVACVWGAGGSTGTGFLQSRNNGEGWHNDFRFGTAVPALPRPAALAALEGTDTVFCVWVSGEQPQFVASVDGGVTWE